MESQIKNGGFLKIEKPIFNFWLKTLGDSKVEAGKDHVKGFKVG